MAERTTLTILVGALALIVEPEGWTQGAGARDPNGDRVKVLAPEASCFCPVAAIGRVAGSHLCAGHAGSAGHRHGNPDGESGTGA